MYIFCYDFQSIVNLKLKLWGCNEKKMGFHLIPKNYCFGLSPGDGYENVIDVRAFNTVSPNKIFQ